MDLLKILFLFIFITFPLGVLIRISITPQAYIYPVDFAVCIFLLVAIYHFIIRKKSHNIFYPFLIFVVIATVSLVTNFYWLTMREFIVSSLYLFRLILYLSLTPLMYTCFKKSNIPWLLTVVVVSLFSTVVFGFMQYFLYPDLRNLMYLGWDEHYYRIFTSFLDPNFASIIYIICFWVGLALLRVRKKKDLKYFSMAVICVLALVALLFTYSRTGYVAFSISAILYFLLERKIKLLLILGILFISGIYLLPKDYQSEGVNLFRTASVFSRIETFQTAKKIFTSNPVLGVGFNTYRYAQEKEETGQVNITTSHAGAGVSNSYLFVLATTGILGFAAFLYGVGKLIVEIKLISQTNGVLGHSLGAVVTTVLVGSLVENIFFYSFVLILLSILVGIGRLARVGK